MSKFINEQDEEWSGYCNDLVELLEKEIEDSYGEDYWQGLRKAIEIVEQYFKA